MQYFNRDKNFTSTQIGKRPKSSSFVRKVPRGSLSSKNKDNPNKSLQKEPSKDSDNNELQMALQLRAQAHSTTPSLSIQNKKTNMVRRKLSTKLGINKDTPTKPIIIINTLGSTKSTNQQRIKVVKEVLHSSGKFTKLNNSFV